MRVLHLTPEFPPVIWGGLGTAVGGLVNASARSGLDVGVLLVGGVLVLDHVANVQRAYGQPIPRWQVDGERWSVPVNPEGVNFFHVAPEDALQAAVRLVKTWKPDVVHLHTGWLGHIARAIRDEAGVPFVFTVHSLDRVEYAHGIFMWGWETQEAAIAVADRVIAISKSERALLSEYCPYAQDRVRVVGNGIDDTELARDAVRRRVVNKSPLVLYSGRFVDRKGIRELLQAIPLVLERIQVYHHPGHRHVLFTSYGCILPDTGIMRITLLGDFINAGKVSVDVNIHSVHGVLPQVTAAGTILDKKTKTIPISIPSGVQNARFSAELGR